MTYDPSIFNINPYYDDFSHQSGFLRVLFRPGYSVQGRELTQAQTILQNQISKIGDHLFKDGSRVLGAGINVRTTSTVRITVASLTAAGVTDYTDLIGNEINTVSTKARIVNFLPTSAGGSSTHILASVDFLNGVSFAAGGVTYSDGSALTLVGTTETGKLVTVSEGIFYIDGFFVRSETESLTPSRVVGLTLDAGWSGGSLFEALDTRIGYQITRDTVTSQENTTLQDPSIGSSNYNAPGADRYKITVDLIQSGLTAQVDDFLELLRFEKGKITKKSERVSYAEIEKTLARRTFDESGSYIVKPFDLRITDDGGSTLGVLVGGGKAYVLGHELETQYPKNVEISKAQTLKSETSINIPMQIGNYVGVCMGASASSGITFSTKLSGVAAGGSISASALVTFRTISGAVQATGYVHAAIPVTSSGLSSGYNYNLYLYGITGSIAGASSGAIYNGLTAGQTLGTFVPMGSGSTFPEISDANNQSLVFEITPGYAISQITNIVSPTKIWTDLISSGSGYSVLGDNATVSVSLDISKFSDTISSSHIEFPTSGVATSDITVVNSQGRALFVGNVTGSHVSSTTSTFGFTYADGGSSPTTGGFTSGNLRFLVPVKYKTDTVNTAKIRTKTSTAFTESGVGLLKSSATTVNGRSVLTTSYRDVYAISSIESSLSGTTTDITDIFELDDGQKEAYYDLSIIVVKPSYQSSFTGLSANTQFTVTGSYFAHGGEPSAPFAGATSYIGVSFSGIPIFTNPRTGKSVSLANCLDFRHTGITSGAVTLKPYNSTLPGVLSYSHYLPRTDKLCLKTDPSDGSPLFFSVSGTPDMSPVAEATPSDSIVLYSLSIPAYTHNATDVTVTPYENKRFTMQDIGKIEKRVDDVEVFAKLSISESEIESRALKTITSANTEPIKTSIFAEEFVGHSIGDVSSHEHICSVDFELGELRPYFTPSFIAFSGYNYVNNTQMSSDGLITLSYSSDSYIENTASTKQIVVNSSNTLNWLGFAKITESVSPNYDLTYRPVTQTNALSENDNWIGSNALNAKGFGTQWNDWESQWTGIEDIQTEQDDVQNENLKLPRIKSLSVVPNINSGSVTNAIQRTIIGLDENISNRMRISRLKNRIKNRIGSRIVDSSVLAYIPAKGLTLDVYGLKPGSTNLSVYFDGVSVKSGLSADEYGSVGCTFDISANTFLAGEKLVRITDNSDPENAVTSADVAFYSKGLLNQRDSGSYSTRPPIFRRQTVSSETIYKDPFLRDFSGDVLENSQYSDPLSQTFFVDVKNNPEGIFISSVDLYFSAKDSYLPVTVQIRPTVNGYPSSCVCLPFSTTTVLPVSVGVNATAPTATAFTFSSPVYLEPGEYALCILTNSNNYSVHAVDTGFNAESSGSSTAGRVGGNSKVGSLYTSTSIGLASVDNASELMFKMNKCVFTTQGSFGVSTSNVTNKQVIKINASEIIPYGCGVTRTIADGTSNIVIGNNTNVYPTTLLGGSTLTVAMTGNINCSPIVDTQTFCGVGVAMQCGTPDSSYVTRVVSVDSEISNGLCVFVQENTPVSTSSIVVSYRVCPVGQADILTRAWTVLTRNVPAVISGSDLDYTEGIYSDTLSEPFTSYQIKIDLQSSLTPPTYHQTPAVRSLRCVSFVV